MKLIQDARETFTGDPDWHGLSSSLEVRYDNRGDPYREGVVLTLEHGGDCTSVFLTTSELKRLRACLSKLLGVAPT